MFLDTDGVPVCRRRDASRRSLKGRKRIYGTEDRTVDLRGCVNLPFVHGYGHMANIISPCIAVHR